MKSGLKVYFWLWGHLCDQVLIFRRTAEILGTQLQILEAPTPKEHLKLQKEQLRLRVAIWAYSRNIEQKKSKRIRIFHTKLQ